VRPRNRRGSPSARGIPFWVSGAAAALLTFGVLVALVSLHGWSVQRQLASQSVSSLRTIVAVEQESVLDSTRTTASLQGDANAALLLVRTTDPSSATLPVIVRMTHAYQAAVSTEIYALLFGDAKQASKINIDLGDPAFTALDSELATVGNAEASNAASGVTAAFVASIGLVAGSGVLVLLFTVYARRRRATIAAEEARAARLASEARVAATREETFRSLFDENPQAMLVTTVPAASTEDGDLPFLAVNNAALTMYGYTRAEFLRLTLVEIRPPEDRNLLRNNLHAMRGGRTHFEGIRHSTKSGDLLDVEVDTRGTIFDGAAAMVVCASDVTDRVRLQRELEHQAVHDALTGLPNRALFADRLEHAHQRLSRGTGWYAVLMLDLDNFKTVNDGLGHASGDMLLLEVSRRIAAVIRAGDTAARIGGDEFAILLEDLADPDDAAILLPVLAEVHQATEGQVQSVTRREADWIIRIRRAVADLPGWDAYLLARDYLARGERNEDTADLDWYLVMAPWRPGNGMRYIEAARDGRVPGGRIVHPERVAFFRQVEAKRADEERERANDVEFRAAIATYYADPAGGRDAGALRPPLNVDPGPEEPR